MKEDMNFASPLELEIEGGKKQKEENINWAMITMLCYIYKTK